MTIPKWISWAGLAAMIGGLIAILLTPPFAIAGDTAYHIFDVPPFWMHSLKPALTPLLTFAPPVAVYNTYGRMFDLVYLLFLPAMFGLHHLHQGVRGRIEKWGFAVVVIGLIAAFIGVAGDYWVEGVVFYFSEIFGLLLMPVGTTLYGVAILRSGVVPRWCGWLLVSCLPGTFVFSLLIPHIPSGQTFLFAVSWLMMGLVLLFNKGVQLEKHGAG